MAGSRVDAVRSFLRALTAGPHRVMLRRFVVVGVGAATIQLVLLAALVEWGGIQYLIAALLAIETTIVLQYFVNNAWTFRASMHTTLREYFTGLLRTNVVRGTAIPIQLGVLWGLVSMLDVFYLAANVFAIGVSGLYRYALDFSWTWG